MNYLILMPIVLLAGSFDDLKQQLARCEIEAAKTYPSFIDAPSGQPLAAIQLCMKAAGFNWIGIADPKCAPSSIMMGKPDLDDGGAHCFASSNSN